MSRNRRFSLRRLIKNQGGAIAIWSAMLIPLIMGVGGLTVDLGNAYICQYELQMSTNAAAMAAAAQLPSATGASSSGMSYGAEPGNLNAYPNLNKPIALTNVVTTVTPGCVTITNLPQCGGSITANAVQVKQTTTVQTFLLKALAIFGVRGAQSIQLSAMSTAVMRGALRGPDSVALVVDTTESMQDADGGSNCSGTRIQCALQGAQILLAEFSPCMPGLTSCGTATDGNVTNPVDEVSLFTFPAQTPGSQVTYDQAYDTSTNTSCSGKNENSLCPEVVAYPDSTTYSGTVSHSNPTMPTLTTANLNTLASYYDVVPLSSNFRTSDTTLTSDPTNPLTVATSGGTTTNPSLVNAIGGDSYYGGTSETGMLAEGGEKTFFAGALFTAQEYLTANARSNATNVIILLSDGDANVATFSKSDVLNSNGNYPSNIDGCQQAIDVATAAKAAGTVIYVVGYGVAKDGCESDSNDGLTACSTLEQIASPNGKFFVDGSSVSCAGATTVVINGQTNTLAGIFEYIAGDLTLPRLVPNTITFTPVS